MEEIKELTNFYHTILDDNRISPVHISLYMALFQLYNLNKFQNPVQVNRRLLMNAAKISGTATFHKCIKDLHEFGYIFYEPSYNPSISTLVYLLELVKV